MVAISSGALVTAGSGVEVGISGSSVVGVSVASTSGSVVGDGSVATATSVVGSGVEVGEISSTAAPPQAVRKSIVVIVRNARRV